jgi:hypothetical protein
MLLGISETKKQQKDELVQKEKKNFRAPLLSSFMSFSFFVYFLWKCHLKLYKTFLKCKDNRMTFKDLKL